MNSTHEVLRQLSSAVLCLLGDVPRLTPQGAARPQEIHACSRRREQDPARPNPALAIASSLGGIGDVGKSFCEINQPLGKPIDVSHLQTPLSIRKCKRRDPRQEPFQTPKSEAGPGLWEELVR